MPVDVNEVLNRWAAGTQSSAEIAADLGLKRGAAVRNIVSRAREQSGGTDSRAIRRPSHHDFAKWKKHMASAILRVKESAYGQAKKNRSKARKR
jgi:hypothetical protein